MAAAVVVAPAYLLRALMLERGTWFSGAATQIIRFAQGHAKAPNRNALHVWVLKAFFIPIYALFLVNVINASRTMPLDTPAAWLVFAVTACYTIDLAFGLAGYVFASNNLVPTIRDTNPSPLGWVVCLVCYPPISHHWPAALSVAALEVRWPQLATMSQDPVVLVGAAAMLLAMAVYIPATVVFGLRFSNLTNRGVITSGPYRLTKHPAYLAHIVNAWVIVCIFLPASGARFTWDLVLVPLAYTVLYTLRMKTEEAHMRSDPDYQRYEEWIGRYGAVARLSRTLKRMFPRTGKVMPSAR